MNKKERLQIISDLISENAIDTQEEIVTRLQAIGIKATQATVSRDIKALGIVKVPSESGYIYDLPHSRKRKMRPQKNYLHDFAVQPPFIYLKVEPGTSAVVKRQLSEQLSNQLFSVIADDDSILMVVKEGAAIEDVLAKVKEI
ncbi:arginine repressor [Streptococcus merionis]|uniref:arginine repressor n=1 Tax=Streptococcus merionis TaxID=400065 RepID=UPI0026EB3A8A|nr:arginine repressor [Streptococcus merionis]